MITKTVHVWNKSSKFHWFVINKSRVIEVHWKLPHKSWNQYRVCPPAPPPPPPLAAVAALILLWIELTKALTVRIGMLFHSSINAFLSCARVAGGFRRFLTLLSSSSHMCSIGVKSGLYGGHASGAMLLFARKSWQTRETCGRALSCCRIRLRCCTSGTATGRKISSLYLSAVILPRLFPMRQWRRVLFTDDSRFTLYRADGRRRVYRRRGERFADACVVERDRFGGGSVMVWGGFAHGIKSQLIIVAGNMTAVRYRDEILRPVAVPLVQQRNLILQQDNARPHVARVCQDFLANNNIAPLAWPPYSPDLTPIEHIWDELDRRVRKRRNSPPLPLPHPPPATLAQLRNALIDEWNNIPMRTVNALVNSIQRRIRAATAARGGHTRYWFSVCFWFQDLGGSYQWTSITRDLLITNQWNLELLFHICTVL